MEIRLVIKSLGIIVALIAVVYMLRPDMAKRFIGLFQKGRRIYLDGVMNCALAAVLLIGARDCRYPWIIFVCGSIFLVEGLLILGLGPEKTRPLLVWSLEQPEELFQFLGLFLGIFGIAMMFSA
jgi:hypothetical protein